MTVDDQSFVKSRSNNFSILRLFFASLVIISHSPEIIDGNRSREILTKIFGTISFGELSVDAFFLISGFLIVKSFLSNRSHYVVNRVARIVPGYLVCFAACLFILSPLAGMEMGGLVKPNVSALIKMTFPVTPGAFEGLPYPSSNGSMWTIGYEFRCYMLVYILGIVGLLSTRFVRLMPILAVALIVLFSAVKLGHVGGVFATIPEPVLRSFRLFGIFFVGSSFYFYRNEIRFSSRYAVGAAVALAVSMFSPLFAEVAVALFGGYLIFWFAYAVPQLSVSRLADENDISYGMYLYAWPVQISFVWFLGISNPWILCVLTFVVTPLLAAASWFVIEKPSLRFAHGMKTRISLGSS